MPLFLSNLAWIHYEILWTCLQNIFWTQPLLITSSATTLNLSLCPLYPLQSNFYTTARMILVNPLTGHIKSLCSEHFQAHLEWIFQILTWSTKGSMCSGPWLQQQLVSGQQSAPPLPQKHMHTHIYTHKFILNLCVAHNLQLVINYTVWFTVNVMY